ncbi:hypothetical protein I3249_08345 [Psychrobacter sp. Ps1]|uniref:hypothetical protein n=1 Tax=Psychrobacter sp. Ps1 TaxID=2790955 RepID=UPI001EDDD119|nr:hypothetical protein [Psychrobacter sp. Ps1]MCG3842782.1 hypothetical protein [Psychrobacter sp. Ps1]
MNNTGFVAGTLILTDKGLVPIQDIKVGDLVLSKPVLSKPEDGSGDIEYKPVLKTFVHKDKEMWIVRLEKNNTSPYRLKPDDENFDIHNYLLVDEKIQAASRFSSFLATLNHPVWIVGAMENPQADIEFYDQLHFKRVDELQQYEIAVNTDGVMYTVERVQPTYQIAHKDLESNPNYFWYQKHYHEDYYDDYVQDAEAHMLDYSEAAYKSIGYVKDLSFYQQNGYLNKGVLNKQGGLRTLNYLKDHQDKPIPYTTTVYNFEVADNHTCFIDQAGLWVHDASSNN